MSEVNLPREWSSATVAEINDYKSSSMQPKNYVGTVFELYSVPIFPEGKPEVLKAEEIGSSKQFVSSNDVLVCKINPRINRVWRVPAFQKFDQIASSEWIVVRQDSLDSQYLTWYFRSEDFRTRLCADVTGVGGSLTRAQPKQVATFKLPIPPLAEQKVIADKLDTLLAQVERTQARLERIPDILKRFRQSVLAAAVSGKLTEEWRESSAIQTDVFLDTKEIEDREQIFEATKIHGIPRAWVWTRFGNTGQITGGGTPSKSNEEFWGGSVPWVTPKDMKVRKIGKSQITITEKGVEKSSAKFINEQSLLFVTRGMILAHSFPVAMTMKKLTINQDMKAISPHDGIISDYLLLVLEAKKGIFVDLAGSSTHGTKRLEAKHLFNVALPIPPKEEQTEIVRRVEELFTFADNLEAKAQAALARVNKLTQSILAKAFRGELTLEWRAAHPELISGEHSAEALLAKIKAERVARHVAAKPRKKAKGK